MVDAAAGGPSQIGAAWRGWRLFVFVYLAFSILRNLGMRFWTPLAAWTMQEMTNEGFKRVPRGFAPDHPHADLLKRRGLVVEFPALPVELLVDARLEKWLARACITAAPLVEWLTFATA